MEALACNRLALPLTLPSPPLGGEGGYGQASSLSFLDWKNEAESLALKNRRAGRARSLRRKRWLGLCRLRAPRDLFFRPEKTQWRSYGAARGHAFEQTGRRSFDNGSFADEDWR